MRKQQSSANKPDYTGLCRTLLIIVIGAFISYAITLIAGVTFGSYIAILVIPVCMIILCAIVVFLMWLSVR